MKKIFLEYFRKAEFFFIAHIKKKHDKNFLCNGAKTQSKWIYIYMNE